MHRLLDAGHRPAQIDGTGLIMQVIDRRMRGIVGAKDMFRLARLVGHPFVGDGHGGEDHPLLIAQRNVLTDLDLGGEICAHIQRHRNRPERAIGGAHRVDHGVVVILGQKALERVETTVHQQFQIADLARRQVMADQIAGRHFEFLGRVVGDVKLGDRGEGHGHVTAHFLMCRSGTGPGKSARGLAHECGGIQAKCRGRTYSRG